ncbi:Rossmann-like and DUF2520 domain-containing protein [Rickettsiella endosymbiont of Dermanyssus gallinae]|uniref:Rossmann-like and DUF2520 domain-containing protein n=1 Tax=Rickettsiella endosymbiont of Dermanyssus gallinae TaxID=2856608 RepID=UPI001C5328C0|nr:Rossmann-like and DUF2520 domain-containing protein [Rickettsiella endosymbiont of Dermanyssus gallinae]
MKLKLNIIGCGRLGKTLAFLLRKTNLVFIQDIYNSSINSSESAVAFIGEGTACHRLKQFRFADLYLIATPDDAIEMVCKQLVEQAAPKSESLVFHCSGLQSSDSLNSARTWGCYTASVHPIFSFSNPLKDIENFAGTYCALEGDKQALEIMSPLIAGIGGQLFPLSKESKALYHAACVFSSNYIVTLSAMAEDCYQKAGLPYDLAKTLANSLMTQSLNKLKATSALKALTGPIQRGDKETLKKHLHALKPFSELEQVYKSLGKSTVPLTVLVPELKKALAQLLA